MNISEIDVRKTLKVAEKLLTIMAEDNLKYNEMLAALECAKGTINGIISMQHYLAGMAAGMAQITANIIGMKPGEK